VASPSLSEEAESGGKGIRTPGSPEGFHRFPRMSVDVLKQRIYDEIKKKRILVEIAGCYQHPWVFVTSRISIFLSG